MIPKSMSKVIRVIYPLTKCIHDLKIFIMGLMKLDANLLNQNRKIIFDLDNSHKANGGLIRLAKIKLQILIVNITSKIQPLDQEISHALKIIKENRSLKNSLSSCMKDTRKLFSGIIRKLAFELHCNL